MPYSRKAVFFVCFTLIAGIGLCLPAPTFAATYYISPSGNDANSGTTESSPIKNFTKAWQLLNPGDTLLLLDGTYYQTLAPDVRNGAPNPAIDTTDYITYPFDHPERIKNYITIKAKNDGKAIIDGQSQRETVLLGYYTQGGIGNYYILEGLVARNSASDVYFIQSHNVIVRRSSGYNANTHRNVHVFTVWSAGDQTDPSNILLEDNFASGTGRKMFVAYASYVNVIFRRNAGLWTGNLSDLECQNDWPNGDNIEIYNWNQPDINNNSIVENNIALGRTPSLGISLAPNPARTIGNKFLGNISIYSGMNIDGTSKVWSCSDLPAACQSGTKCAAEDWSSSDWMVHRGGISFNSYARPYFKNNVLQDAFAWGNASVGLVAGEQCQNCGWCDGSEADGTYPCARCTGEKEPSDSSCSPYQKTPSERSSNNILNRVTLTNNSIGSPPPFTGAGLEVTEQSLNTFRNFGTLGSMYIEGDSRYANKANGARLRYRYVNGELMDGTNGKPTQELWPWPMEQRIKDELAREFGIQNFSVTNTLVPLINQHTAVQVPLLPTPTGPTPPPPSPTTYNPQPTPTPSSSCPQKPRGDADCNGVVRLSDFELWRREYTGFTTTKHADFNADGTVSLADYELWRRGYF